MTIATLMQQSVDLAEWSIQSDKWSFCDQLFNG
jgi:hypothetical protein